MYPSNCLVCRYSRFSWEPDLFGDWQIRQMPKQIHCLVDGDEHPVHLTKQQIVQVFNRGCGKFDVMKEYPKEKQG